jgi:hypothetical protein
VDRHPAAPFKVVDNRVDRTESGLVSFVLPEAAVRIEETEITSRAFDPDRSLRALLYPLAAASQPPPGSAWRDVIGIPVSILPPG